MASRAFPWSKCPAELVISLAAQPGGIDAYGYPGVVSSLGSPLNPTQLVKASTIACVGAPDGGNAVFLW
jgi:hypothetical protein